MHVLARFEAWRVSCTHQQQCELWCDGVLRQNSESCLWCSCNHTCITVSRAHSVWQEQALTHAVYIPFIISADQLQWNVATIVWHAACVLLRACVDLMNQMRSCWKHRENQFSCTRTHNCTDSYVQLAFAAPFQMSLASHHTPLALYESQLWSKFDHVICIMYS